MSSFEQSLLALDVKLEEAQKLAKAVVAAIGRTRAALKVGRVGDISRGLGVISQRIDQANAAVDGLANDWSFDVSGYLTDGRFVADLKQAASEKDLLLFENEGRIYCFPLLLRVDAKEFAVKVGKKLERRIRPNELVRLLADAQKRPLRFRESQFFELLYRAWRRGTERRLCRGCGAAPPSRVGANAIAGGTAEAQNATVAARDRPRERGLRLNNLAVPASRSRFFAIVSPNFPPAKNRAMRRWCAAAEGRSRRAVGRQIHAAYVKSWASDAASNQRSGRLQQPLSRRECALGCPPPANEPVRHRPWRVATDCSAIAIDYTENAKIEDAAEGGGSDAEA